MFDERVNGPLRTVFISRACRPPRVLCAGKLNGPPSVLFDGKVGGPLSSIGSVLYNGRADRQPNITLHKKGHSTAAF